MKTWHEHDQTERWQYIFYCYDNLILSGEFLLRKHWSKYLFELLM